MDEKKFAFGVNFQKHDNGSGDGCCVKSNIIVADDIVAAATWAKENCPEGWTVSVAEVAQPVVVL